MTGVALYGVKAARLTLEAGFTTVRNVGADDFGDVALRDGINDGDYPGGSAHAGFRPVFLGIKGGHCDNNLLPPEYNDVSRGVADGPWAAHAKVREMVKYGADLIKICASGGVLSKGDESGAQQYTLEEMQAIVAEEAHKLGRKVAAHAHGTSSIRTGRHYRGRRFHRARQPDRRRRHSPGSRKKRYVSGDGHL